MSVRLTTSLSQRLVLTPQLRQRIEMLQMTTVELSELIQQQLLENPILEEVPSQEETHELAEKILDQLESADHTGSLDLNVASDTGDLGSVSSNGSGDATEIAGYVDPDAEYAASGEMQGTVEHSEEMGSDEGTRDAFEEIDFGREFQDYLDPGYKTQEFE